MTKPLHLTYHLKQLILLTRFSYGYYRTLRNFKDPNFKWESSKRSLLEKYDDKSWKNSKGGNVRYRDYSSYDEYRTHQVQKFDAIIKTIGGLSSRDIRDSRSRFYRRFRHMQTILPLSAKILCLGARQGTEVEVLRDLGFKNAIGIDLNPGPNNPLVKQGDFMALDYPDNSLDMVYSNCVDHAFELDKFFQEHARVVKPGGYALYDLADQSQAGGGIFESVQWKFEQEVFLVTLKYFRKLVKVESEDMWQWFLFQKFVD